jgi:UDP:flavonoid glycosyltransferase YjiC (YdhE family)
MRIFIMAMGTRGDLELFLGLARELDRRGHVVLMATSPFYGPAVQQAGLEWTPVGSGTFEQQLEAFRAQTTIGSRLERVRDYAKRWLVPQIQQSAVQIRALVSTFDYFINNMKILLPGRDGRPQRGAWVLYDPPLTQENMRTFDANQPSDGTILNLVAMNQRLLDPENQWGPRYHFTGFWKVEPRSSREPGEDLQAFLQAGPPPVVLTMGSMVMFEPVRLVQVFTAALRLSGQRGLIVGGWSGISRVPPADLFPPLSEAAAPPVFCVDEVSYDWLFPRAACVIHHGGCGTLSAVLRAGQPSIVLPQIPPQEIFGHILERESLGTGVLETTTLRPEVLAEAIRRAVTDERVRESCRVWQPVMNAERGMPLAVDLIEAHGKQLPGPAAVPPVALP